MPVPNNQNTPKPSDTVTYSGILNPASTSGTVQCGGWADLDTPPYGFSVEVLQGVPAQTKVGISGPGVVEGAVINQSNCQISITERSLQVTGHTYEPACQDPV